MKAVSPPSGGVTRASKHSQINGLRTCLNHLPRSPKYAYFDERLPYSKRLCLQVCNNSLSHPTGSFKGLKNYVNGMSFVVTGYSFSSSPGYLSVMSDRAFFIFSTTSSGPTILTYLPKPNTHPKNCWLMATGTVILK